jgi:hypothetical protein
MSQRYRLLNWIGQLILLVCFLCNGDRGKSAHENLEGKALILALCVTADSCDNFEAISPHILLVVRVDADFLLRDLV